MKLANSAQAHGNPPNLAFPPEDYQAGRISNPSDSSNPRPVTQVVGAADWIICAVNTRGQQRYEYGNFNGWCWDGQSMRDIWSATTYAQFYPQGGPVPPTQLSYFACRIDFQGSPGPTKRDQIPLGHFGGEPIYGAFCSVFLCCVCVSVYSFACRQESNVSTDRIPRSLLNCLRKSCRQSRGG